MIQENRNKKTLFAKGEREDIISAFRESGMTQKSFADSRSLNVGTFRSWLYSADPTPGRGDGFIEVSIGGHAAAIATIRFPGGTTLDLPLDALERSAVALARELGSPC